ncbi:MAG: class I SAM-dependent methyltransferase, partial [Sideroxyarcus sp.]|nr:class I SAM-dependent methyltransferase [Sideroxyarcus sp.]
MVTTTCPDCRANDLEYIGAGISFGNYAGGKLMVAGHQPPVILRCSKCCLVFKYPRIDEAQSLALYNAVDGSVWSSSMPRPEFDVARRVVGQSGTAGPTVLDVGCNRGEFLSGLAPEVRKYGVEVNRTAAACARQTGIHVWSSIADIPDRMIFDVVTCFDVVEHINAPSGFVRSLLSLLKPGGFLVISSGDADVFLRQPRPALNWYFSNPEHVSFVSAGWFHSILTGMPGYKIEQQVCFLHGHSRKGLLPLLKIATFKTWPSFYLACYTRVKAALTKRTEFYVPGNGF